MPIGAFLTLPFHSRPRRRCDDHPRRCHPRWIIGRAAASGLLAVLASHADLEPVEKRQRADASIGETAPQSAAPVGAGGQHRILGSSDGVEALADQDFDVRIGVGDGAANRSPTGLGFDIADPHLQMPLAVLIAADEPRVQGHRTGRRHCWPGYGINPERPGDLQGISAHRLRSLSGRNRKPGLRHVSGHPVRHQGGEMCLQPVQFRRRPAMRWPSNASLDRATASTVKTRKSHRERAKLRRDSMVPVVLQGQMPRQIRHAGRRTGWLLVGAATIACCRPASHRFASATVGARLAISARSSARLIVMTAVNGWSPSASICTSLTIQAARPPLVRKPRRKYRSGPYTRKLAGVPLA
jgi:hypothetical protein